MPKPFTSRALLGLFTLLAASACSVQRAHTVPFTGTSIEDNKGVVYSVPKTYLSLSLTYAYIKDDLHPAQPQAHLAAVSDDQPDPSIKITTLTAPDAKSTFIIKTDELLSNVLFLSSINFKYANGTLAAVDASSVDRTGEILEQLGTTAVNLAKAAAKGTNQSPHEQAIRAAELRIDQIYAEIAKASAEPIDPAKPSKSLDNLETELATMRKVIKDLRSNLDPPVRTLTAILPILIDPDSPTKSTPDYLEYEIKPPQLFADVPAENMDILTIRIYDDNRRQFIHILQAGNPSQPKDIPGILYRQPVRLLTKVFLNAGDDPEPTELFSGLIPYLQFTPPAIAVLNSKVLTAKHTTLILDPTNGGLLSYGIAQDSAVERITQSAENISDQADHSDNSNNNNKSKSKSNNKTSSSKPQSTPTPTSTIQIPAIEGAATAP